MTTKKAVAIIAGAMFIGIIYRLWLMGPPVPPSEEIQVPNVPPPGGDWSTTAPQPGSGGSMPEEARPVSADQPVTVLPDMAPSAATPAPPDASPSRSTPESQPPAAAGWAGEGGGDSLPVRVDLPTGETLIEAMLLLADNWQQLAFADDASVNVDKRGDGTVRAVAATDRGKLDGSLVLLNTEGRLTAMASYARGSRAGPLRAWEENHRCLLYCDFARNQRDGLTCLFRNGEPWLVERWKKGVLRESYLVRREAEKYRAVASDQLGAAAGQWRQAQQRLETLLTQFSQREAELAAMAAASTPVTVATDPAWRDILARCW